MKSQQFLRLHAVLSTLALVFLFTTGASDAPKSAVFDKITVRQIDVVDSVDRVRVQLAGEYGPRRTDLSGLLFHNEDGNEAGGLVYSGKKDENGVINAGAILTFDQYGEDQIMSIQYAHRGDVKRTGMTISDRPDEMGENLAAFYRAFAAAKTPEEQARLRREVLPTIPREELPASRLYFGRTQDNASTINLYDPQGRVRLKMEVNEDGVPRIEFFDAQGESIKKISVE